MTDENRLLPAAVLWDMDGTLVDTEPYWMQAESELVESWGGQWTHDDGLMLVGSGLWRSAEIIRSHGVDMPLDDIVFHLTDRVQERLDAEGVPWRPGARELLLELRHAKIPTALVTMSIRRMADQIVKLIPFDAFDVVVSGDEVENPKPHPEPYLAAARALGVDARDCVAIEDSLTGVTAAVASGAVTVGVPLVLPLPESADHTLWPTLDGRTLDDVAALFRSRRDARSDHKGTE